MASIAIVGATTWGNTIGHMLSDKGHTVSIWARKEAQAEALSKQHRETCTHKAPHNCPTFTSKTDLAISGTEFVIWAVPAQSMRQNVKQIKHCLTESMVLVSVAKGLEANSGKRMSEVITEEVMPSLKDRICVLSGPNLSREIDQGLPATSVVAAQDANIAKKVQELLDSTNFSVFTSDDVIGVELCGALKNVLALGAGIVDGLGLGDNTKSALITLGWAEVVSLGTAMGCDTATFYGLAGMGDLIATCSSDLSRNHYVGFWLAKGHTLAQITASMQNVAEGVDTTIAAHSLAKKLGLKVPLIELVYRVLYESLPPAEISTRLRDGLRPD